MEAATKGAGMSTQTEDRATDTPTNHDDNPMVHFSDPPYTHGLCGKKIRGTDALTKDVDCVVCAQMDGYE